VDHPEGLFRATPFDHRQHVKFAWTVLSERPLGEAQAVVADEISRFAAINAPGLYHETLTQFWVRLVAHTREHSRPGTDFDTHVARFPILSDKSAAAKHYSRQLLDTPEARNRFLSPDLLPLPTLFN
jgi:hypothetical protein